MGVEFDQDENASDKELLEEALFELMKAERSDIRKVLLAEFGGESMLFVSLWNTVDYSSAEELELFESSMKQ